MKTSTAGINLIKKFEGCRLNAYKPVPTEKYWTIGYGHYGPDVSQGMVITQAQAEIMLGIDLQKYEQAVERYTPFPLAQNQFDALVSFTYNCGAGNLQQLVKKRNALQVADAMLRYNKAGGKELAGLTRRRVEERALFMKGFLGNPYPEPIKILKKGSKGDGVRWLQSELQRLGYPIKADGIFGPVTEKLLLQFQTSAFTDPKEHDGICGPKTRDKLKMS